MKTQSVLPILIFTLIVFVTQSLFASDGKYIEAMQKNIQVVYSPKSIDELQRSVNSFERIAAAEKTKWEPYYYASFGYIMMANMEKEGAKKDEYLDLAIASLDKAKAINEAESEIIALEGFVHMIRITVDPASRGQHYAGLAMQAFGKAVQLNPENPRALALLAQMQYGTAQFFGSPATEACSTLNAALEKFTTFKSDNVLAPQWGKQMTEELKEQCK